MLFSNGYTSVINEFFYPLFLPETRYHTFSVYHSTYMYILCPVQVHLSFMWCSRVDWSFQQSQRAGSSHKGLIASCNPIVDVIVYHKGWSNGHSPACYTHNWYFFIVLCIRKKLCQCRLNSVASSLLGPEHIQIPKVFFNKVIEMGKCTVCPIWICDWVFGGILFECWLWKSLLESFW
jgi:hypothetical protein